MTAVTAIWSGAAAADPEPITANGNYGLMAFLVFFFIAMAIWALARSMNKHIRNINNAARLEKAKREQAMAEGGAGS